MANGESDKLVSVAGDRLERVVAAIAFASTGAFDEAIAHLGSAEQDRFGVIEESLRVLLADLALATEDSARALAEAAAARKELEEKLTTIEHQRESIRELSVPIIDVWDDVITLPLVGLLDTARALDVQEKLLKRVVDTKVRWVLLDVTGVAVVDTGTAHHFIQLAKAVQLLGARCILTGINENIAMTLVALGVSFEALTPMRSLQQALKFCLAQRDKRAEKAGRRQPPRVREPND